MGFLAEVLAWRGPKVTPLYFSLEYWRTASAWLEVVLSLRKLSILSTLGGEARGPPCRWWFRALLLLKRK